MRSPVVCAVLAIAATVAHADVRSFTYTYEYSTVPEGETSLQLWHTQGRRNTVPKRDHYEGVLEIEHGLTEKLDMGFYTFIADSAVREGAQDGLRLSRAELQGRYRLSERGELPVDTQLMLTAGKLFGTGVYSVSGRVIGAHDMGDLTLAANVEGELITGSGTDENELLLRWMVGATYAVHPRVRIGAETWAVMADGTSYIDAGPALSFIASPKFWVAATFGVAVTKRDAVVDSEHATYAGRAIFGIEL